MTRLKTKAFTLIELLVVVAIISLLSSVVIASVSDAREKAALSKIIQQVRQVQTALELYRGDHNNYPLEEVENDTELDLLWENYLQDYMGRPNLLVEQIKSFSIQRISFINNSLFSNGFSFSCEGYQSTPYVIIFTTPSSNLDFPRLAYLQDGIQTNMEQTAYCLMTPI